MTDPLVKRVKDRLYPLTRFTLMLEWLVERLPRQIVPVHLTPRHNVVCLHDLDFRSVGNEPILEIARYGLLAQGGWFYLEAALVRHTGDREAGLVGRNDSMRTSTASFNIPIPSNLRGTIREVIYLPAGEYALYWSPMRTSGYFSQSELLLHRITWIESWLRRMHRVLLTIWQNRHASLRLPENLTLRAAILDLQAAYLVTARLQIDRYRGHDYTHYLTRRDQLSQQQLHAIKSAVLAVSPPCFRLVARVGAEINATLLDAAIWSIRRQHYGLWKLDLQCEGTLTDDLETVVRRHVDVDTRIARVITHSPTATSNWIGVSVSRASEDFFAVVAAGITLHPEALLLTAREASKESSTQLVYTDHDHIDLVAQRKDPMFKPDWNPDLLISYNYIGDFSAFALPRLRQVGGYRAEIHPACQAYDLLLRVTRGLTDREIRHIPRVLYHQRLSCLDSPSNESIEAGRQIIASALDGTGAMVEHGLRPGLYHVRYPIPDPPPLVSIIVPTRDKLDVLRTCVNSVQQRTTYPNWEMIIVDNRSQDPATIAWLADIQRDPRIRVLRDDREFNYSALNNRAVEHAWGKVLVLLNNDTEVIAPHWLTEMVGHALRPDIGAVGAKLLYPNGMVQHAGVVLGIGGVAGHVHRYLGANDPGYANRSIATQNYSAVTAACLAVRKDVYVEVGGLDADHFRVAFNDVDFCLKLLKAGYRNVFTPHALLYHHESLTRGHDDTQEKRETFTREFNLLKLRWSPLVDNYYNDNLTLENEDFSLKPLHF